MANPASTVLEFNGNKYNLQQLIAVAAGCPLVDTNNLIFHGHAGKPLEERFQVKLHGAEAPAPKEAIIFKQEGAYTVLFGTVGPRARLVSTPALKKARFEKPSIDEPASAERVAASTATGAMADKMQQAFGGNRPETKQHQFDNHNSRYHNQPVRDHASQKVQNSSMSGSHGKPAGYSEMTSHQRAPGFTSQRPDQQRSTSSKPQYHSNNRQPGFKKP